MRTAIIGTPSYAEFLRWNQARDPARDSGIAAAVAEIIESVRARGLAAAVEYARAFDAPEISEGSLLVADEEMRQAKVSQEHFYAIQTAIQRVRSFHERQLEALTKGWTRTSFGWSWRMPGVATVGGRTGWEGQRMLPLRRVGVYAPGGRASYPSSIIMNAVPAKVAGVEECIVATPARPDGSLNPAVLVAARESGARTVVKVGGAAAIALLAYGCEAFEGVERIVGPGNRFVNEAKRQLWGAVGFDCYAGPSEVCVVADGTAPPRFAALDLLTQVEHGPENVALLVCFSQSVAEAVIQEAERLLEELESEPTLNPERAATIREALSNGWALIVSSEAEAVDVVNLAAPEHVALLVRDPERFSLAVRNSGSISMGPWTAQSAGDYVSGPSHTLPTSRGSRFASPVSVLDFLKVQSVGSLAESDLKALAPTIEAFAQMEGFPMHGKGARRP